MNDKNESISDIIIGEHPKAYILTLEVGFAIGDIFGINEPIRGSLNEYETDYADEWRPLHIFLEPDENYIFRRAMSSTDRAVSTRGIEERYILYERTLREQGINLTAELSKAASQSSDQEAIEYLRQLNLRLRQHVENLAQHYANPVRLRGDKGPTRKPKIIEPINVSWP